VEQEGSKGAGVVEVVVVVGEGMGGEGRGERRGEQDRTRGEAAPLS
jgi:hypothetical protein